MQDDPDDDPFKPPKKPVLVECLHCGEQYQSDKIWYGKKGKSSDSLWWCPTPGCDGAGYGFDIHKADKMSA